MPFNPPNINDESNISINVNSNSGAYFEENDITPKFYIESSLYNEKNCSIDESEKKRLESKEKF